jgi:Putative beta-barrel porin-2, OmpL-like. bbp2
MRTSLVLLALVPTAALAQTPPSADPAPVAPVAEAKPPVEVEAKPTVPFAFADWTWLSGNARTHESPLTFGNGIFVGEFRVDTAFHYSFHHPKDDTIGGSTEVFRHGELQLTQLGIGGDFNYKNAHGRLMTQFGMYSQTTPRNDTSPKRGQWQLDDAYRYLSEAYGGYHIDKDHGINIQAGIFMSYIGLWSYYNFDNWTYQPSYVSSNTPWFFTGVRLQWFPTDKLKIEPWIVNGWQSYGRYNKSPGGGGQIMYRPTANIALVFNNWAGTDTLGVEDRVRIHTDDSIQVKWYEDKTTFVSKVASTLTIDLGCELGGGVKCFGGNAMKPSQYFAGFMAYTRAWFDHDRYAVTLGGGAITNPGRYLVLVPPINGATAFSGAAPYYTYNAGDTFKAFDAQATFDVMPSDFVTFRFEFNYRRANIPYFSGTGGVTPPGGNTGAPGSEVDGWSPDLEKDEPRFTAAMMVKL